MPHILFSQCEHHSEQTFYFQPLEWLVIFKLLRFSHSGNKTQHSVTTFYNFNKQDTACSKTKKLDKRELGSPTKGLYNNWSLKRTKYVLEYTLQALSSDTSLELAALIKNNLPPF